MFYSLPYSTGVLMMKCFEIYLAQIEAYSKLYQLDA